MFERLEDFALLVLACSMNLLNRKVNSIKLDCSMFENDFSMMIIVILDQALIIPANLPKLCQHIYSLQAPSSQNHASVKLAQACCKLSFFLREVLN